MKSQSKIQNSLSRKRSKIGERQKYLLIMVLIPMLYVFIFSYLPICGIVIAFKDYKYNLGIFGSKWVGFDNFKFFISSPDFGKVIWNTVYLNFRFIIINTITNMTLGILLYELRGSTKAKIYHTILITPHFISWVLVAYILYGFLNVEHGILNNILSSLGLEKMNWYSNPAPWPNILNVASCWKGVGMGCLLYYATLMGIDSSLYEAADIDGASKFKKIIYISIPGLTTITVIQLILAISGMFRSDFGMFYQLTQDSGALYPTTDVMDTFVFRAMKGLKDYGMSGAAGLLQSVVGFILIMITNTIVRKINEENALF